MTRNITALALMFLIGTTTFGQTNISADLLKKHVYSLADDSLEGRGLSTPAGLIAANYIADYFKKIGLNSIGENYLHPFYTRWNQTMLNGNNVVGIIEGSDAELKNEYIILGAHFDHVSYEFKNEEKVVYNGANSNASGTAAIIEIGRALVLQKDKLKRSVVIVAFDGEEFNFLGSEGFIDQNIVPFERIKMILNIEMIGQYIDNNSLILTMGSLKDEDEILFKIAEKRGIEIKKANRKIQGSNASKLFEQNGIPAISFTTGIIDSYTTEDNPATLDYKGIEKISGLIYDFIIEASNRELLEPTKKFIALVNNGGLPFFRYGLKANIGSSFHSYSNEFYNGKPKFSSEVGLMSQFRITKNFSLQPEVLYSTLASGYNTGNFRTHSITTPVSLIIGGEMENKNRFFVNVGGYYSYNFSGSVDGKPMDFDNTFEQTETGLVYGINFEVVPVILSLNFKYGLSNLMKDKNSGELYNRATYFSLGFVF